MMAPTFFDIFPFKNCGLYYPLDTDWACDCFEQKGMVEGIFLTQKARQLLADSLKVLALGEHSCY